MKKFDLEAAKRGVPVQTRDGKPVRIICTDCKCHTSYEQGFSICYGYFPIVALVGEGKEESPHLFNEDGLGLDCENLVMAPTKCKGWINIYGYENYRHIGIVYHSRDEAVKGAGSDSIDVIEIEWEERS